VLPKLKGRQHFDEKFVKVKGKDWYDLNCIDSATKYITAHLFVEKRTAEKCKEFLRQIKATCYNQIFEKYKKEKHKPKKKRKLITFVCDGFENYRTAWKTLFNRVTKLEFGVPIACRKYGLEHNNNPIERHNGSIKSRTKIMRGGFRSATGGEAFTNFKRIIHNFVNPHHELRGKTPAEAAHIRLPLGRSRLLWLIIYVAESRITKR
jgi:transposase-like protein